MTGWRRIVDGRWYCTIGSHSFVASAVAPGWRFWVSADVASAAACESCANAVSRGV